MLLETNLQRANNNDNNNNNVNQTNWPDEVTTSYNQEVKSQCDLIIVIHGVMKSCEFSNSKHSNHAEHTTIIDALFSIH